MNPSSHKAEMVKNRSFAKVNSGFLQIMIIGIMSVSIGLCGNDAFAQSSEQTTLSDNLQNDPIAQDILKKIEQTKKMITELEQKEYERNQAQENLEKMRDLSVQRLTVDLEEWERLWDQYSSRNSFDRFVNKKPDFVQGVFWDQFEFKEQRVNQGRQAMNKVLINGGTMQDAKNAYHKAASIQRVELIEVNSQINIKHNLADYEEQQIFNSTGQVHFSPLTASKLAQFYSDYRLQPNYVLANPDDTSISTATPTIDSENTTCENGFVLVSRLVSQSKTCVDEDTAQKWIDNNTSGILIHKEYDKITNVKTNPATDCGDGNVVVYSIADSEYQCVSESQAEQMISNHTAETHTLVDYIQNKDKKKTIDDTIYGINQEILALEAEYDFVKNNLESTYQIMIEDEKYSAKQKIKQVINEYRGSDRTQADVSSIISEINNARDAAIEKMLDDKAITMGQLELDLQSKIAKAVRGFEGNPDINVDWLFLSKVTGNDSAESSNVHAVQSTEQSNLTVQVSNVDVVNSSGQKLPSIKAGQVLQVVADITNPGDSKQNFAYALDITNEDNESVQPTQWITGTLDANQTFNVGLSWTPEVSGEFKAVISTGMEVDSVFHTTNVPIFVS